MDLLSDSMFIMAKINLIGLECVPVAVHIDIPERMV